MKFGAFRLGFVYFNVWGESFGFQHNSCAFETIDTDDERVVEGDDAEEVTLVHGGLGVEEGHVIEVGDLRAIVSSRRGVDGEVCNPEGGEVLEEVSTLARLDAVIW